MSEQLTLNLPAATRTDLDEDRSGFVTTVLSSRRLLVLVFMFLIFAAASKPIKDPDFYWHLKTGQYLLETRTIPSTDMFSWIKFGSEWVTHEWLSEVIMYSVFRWLGYGGLIVLFAGIVTASFKIVYGRYKEVVGHPYIAGFVLLLGAAATMPTWGVRPQMFSMLLASVFVFVLGEYYRNRRTKMIWWLIPLTILWVNLHAGFAMGLALIGFTIVSLIVDAVLLREEPFAVTWRRVRTLVILLITCGAAVSINPSGTRMYSYPLETLRSQAMMQYIQEWKSPNFHELMWQPLALFFLLTLAVLALSHKRIRPGELLVLLVMALATLRSSRNVPFFVLIAIPIVAESLWSWVVSQSWGWRFNVAEKREFGRGSLVKLILNIALLLLTPLAVVGFAIGYRITNQPFAEAETYPVAAVDFLAKERLPQPIYNEYGWGGYLIWRLYPEYRVSMDGRADVYGDDLIEESLAVHDGEPQWRQYLKKHDVRTVLVKPEVPLASLLRDDVAWQKVFEDPQSVVFVRR
jgi:hypothetical protein